MHQLLEILSSKSNDSHKNFETGNDNTDGYWGKSSLKNLGDGGGANSLEIYMQWCIGLKSFENKTTDSN